jgi:hypothetical protein
VSSLCCCYESCVRHLMISPAPQAAYLRRNINAASACRSEAQGVKCTFMPRHSPIACSNARLHPSPVHKWWACWDHDATLGYERPLSHAWPFTLAQTALACSSSRHPPAAAEYALIRPPARLLTDPLVSARHTSPAHPVKSCLTLTRTHPRHSYYTSISTSSVQQQSMLWHQQMR